MELKNVSFYYRKSQPILNHISLSFQKGSFTSILGTNGCGKTTLLKLIARILVPTEGQLYLNKSLYSTFSQRLFSQKLAYVPANSFPLFSMTVREFVSLGRAPHLKGFCFESQKDKDIIHQSLGDSHTLIFKDRLLHTLSSGERQRVFLAKALAQTPQILLLDEPTSHLDIKHQFEIFSLLKRIHQEKKLTVISVLHDLQLACEFSDRIVFMKDHSVFAEGPPAKLFTEENIHTVFGIRTAIDENPYTQKIRVTYKSLS